MSDSVITMEAVLDEALRIAEADPDHVYNAGETGRCTYVASGDSESCLFGQALLSLGVEPGKLAELEGRPIEEVLSHLVLSSDGWSAGQHRLAGAMSEAQFQQDQQAAWGGVAFALRAAL